MPISTDLTTELAAVNMILAGEGDEPVDALDDSSSVLAVKAQQALAEASRSLQTKGWYWNRETAWTLTKDENDEIVLPANTLSVSEVRGQTPDCIQRGQKLYDRTNHTYKFPDQDSVEVDLTVLLSWEELPDFARQTIAYLAQRRFQMRELTSTAIDKAIADDFDAALAILEQKEDEQGPANSLSDGGVQGYRGNARRRS